MNNASDENIHKIQPLFFKCYMHYNKCFMHDNMQLMPLRLNHNEYKLDMLNISRISDRKLDRASLKNGMRRNRFLRLRYQLLFGLFISAFLPTFLRGGMTFEGLTTGNNLQTMLGVSAAFLIGYFTQRRLSRYPGEISTSYILPSFLASFALVLTLFFFLRIDYVRSIFGVGFLISIICAFLANRGRAAITKTHLGIIPGGRLEGLSAINGIEWHQLKDPITLPKGIQGIVLDLRAEFSDDWERFIANAALAGIPVYHVKQVQESLRGRVEIEHLSENTLGSLNPNDIYLKAKGATDWCMAFLALIILSPVFVLVYVAIRLDSTGPGFFVQSRRGYRGTDFNVWKFRTMYTGNSKNPGSKRTQAITIENDPRITRVGRWLRRCRIDELPQIFNILRSEMSWIGPRPEATVLSDWYEKELPFYRYRHIVKPGITGWAQINQGHVASVDEIHDKLHYDFYYIKNFSMWLDILIVIKTIGVMLGGKGAR